MNKIKINSQLNDWTFCVLATVTLMGLIERGQSIVMLAVFALISLLSGAAFIFIFSILIDRKKEIKVRELIYQGKLSILIEELRFSGLFFYKQIGDVYIFSTNRIFGLNIRLLVAKESEHWCISCEEYSFKQLKKYSYLSLFIEKEKFYCLENNRNKQVRPSRTKDSGY